jgi:hypothetical protein
MSEGRYGRLPKPKDRSRGMHVELGEVTLEPSDKAREYEEETGEEYRPHKKPAPRESALARVGRELAASVSRPWARFTGKDDDE